VGGNGVEFSRVERARLFNSVVNVGLYPIVTLEKQLLNMIGNLA
jgi:hypothetical protein